MSVLVPAYNQRAFLLEALASVSAQTYSPVEVVVVDDGSTDGTGAAVEAAFPWVRYVRQENGGTASARNRGLAEARGELIALLDHDDLWLPGKLEQQVARLVADPAAGGAYGGIAFFNSDTGEARVTGQYLPPERVGVHDLLAHTILPTQTLVFRTRLIRELGGFDEKAAPADDWDICIRAAATSRLLGIAGVLALVRGHPAQQGISTGSMFRAQMRVARRHRHLHPGCAECEAAFRVTRRLLRADAYSRFRSQAHEARSEGRVAGLVSAALLAAAHDPRAAGRAAARRLRLP